MPKANSYKEFLIRLSVPFLIFFCYVYDIKAQDLNTTVYICRNQGKKYHLKKDCKYLGQCLYSPETTTLKNAIDGQDTNKGLVSFSYCKGCSKKAAKIESQYRSGSISELGKELTDVGEIGVEQDETTNKKNKKISKKVKVGDYTRNKKQ